MDLPHQIEADISGHALRARLLAGATPPSGATLLSAPGSDAPLWRAPGKLLVRAMPRAAAAAFGVLLVVTASAAVLKTTRANAPEQAPAPAPSVVSASAAGLTRSIAPSQPAQRPEVRPVLRDEPPRSQGAEGAKRDAPAAKRAPRAPKASSSVVAGRPTPARVRSNDLDYDFGF